MTKEEAAALTALATGIGTTLARIAEELRRLNDGRDQFHAVLLDFFERITEDPQPGPEGSLRSEQPAAAPGCQEGGEAP